MTALGVCAAYCLLAFALLSVGVAGAWMSTLNALAPYKWIFIMLTAAHRNVDIPSVPGMLFNRTG